MPTKDPAVDHAHHIIAGVCVCMCELCVDADGKCICPECGH